jgi:hypothetical protein
MFDKPAEQLLAVTALLERCMNYLGGKKIEVTAKLQELCGFNG